MPSTKAHVAQGQIYDLRKLFKRLNGLYFNGSVKAQVEWGKSRGQKSRRSREFGTYYYQEKLIRIHPVLDQAWVPIYVVEAVLHHEMCHQVCPDQKMKGRRIAHTPAFRRREREYPFFHEAETWMKQNLQALLRAAPTLKPQTLANQARQLALSFAA